jgi:signal transduction histidine kinase
MNQTTRQTAAVDAAALQGVVRVRLSQHAAVAELGQAALLNQDADYVFSMAVNLLCEVLDVEFAKVLHQPSFDEPFVLMAGRGWQDHILVGESSVPCGRESQAGYTLMSDEPVFVDDLATESRFVGPQILIDHGAVSGMSVVIQGRQSPYGVLGVHTARRRCFTAEEGDFLRSVANVLGSAVEGGRFAEHVTHRSRYEIAIAECAQALLASSGEDRIEHALEALLTATESTYVFLERNVIDAELGFCSETVAEVGKPDETDSDYWDLVSWDQMPTSRSHLETGKPFFLIPAELEGVEYDLYAEDPFPVKVELDIPIFVNGEWAGLIGFADEEIERPWGDADVSLLTTAARMVGAFWEREAARERLEEMNAAKDAFLASISHELRTPLTAVVGFSQVLRDAAHTLSAEERAELLETIVGQGIDLTNIVNDLLVAARADIGRLDVASVPVNLRAQTAQVLEAFAGEQITHIELVGNSVRALGDPDRVRQIIRNLTSNALRYGGDAIRVQVCDRDTTAGVLVCDNGAALSEEDRERIFEPYQRAHNDPGLTDSIGLGLAISRQLARLMGGDLTYRHQSGESIFELSLPKTS